MVAVLLINHIEPEPVQFFAHDDVGGDVHDIEPDSPAHVGHDVVHGVDAALDGIGPLGAHEQGVFHVFVEFERPQFQHLAVDPERDDVEKTLEVARESLHLVLLVGVDHRFREVEQHAVHRVVEGEEVVGIGDADFREVGPLQVREHDVAVFIVVDESLEISLFGLFKEEVAQKVGGAVAACRDEEKVLLLKFHLVPLRPNVEVVACKHVADGGDVVIFDRHIGNLVFVLLGERVLVAGQQAVKLKKVFVALSAVFFEFGAEEQVGDFDECGPVVVLERAQLDFHPSVVAVFEHGVQVNGTVSAFLGLFDIVVNHSLDEKRQAALVFEDAVVELVDLFGARQDAPAAGDVLGAVHLHLGKADEFAHDGLDALHAIGADAVFVDVVRQPLNGVENGGQRFLVAHSQLLEHEQVVGGNVVRLVADAVAQSLVVFVGVVRFVRLHAMEGID